MCVCMRVREHKLRIIKNTRIANNFQLLNQTRLQTIELDSAIQGGLFKCYKMQYICTRQTIDYRHLDFYYVIV